MKAVLFRAACLALVVPAASVPGQTVKPMAKLNTGAKIAFAVVCGGGETIAGVDRANEVHVWNVAAGQERLLKADLDAQIDPGALACDQKTIAVGSIHGTVVILDSEGKVKQRADLKEEITGLTLSADGSRLAVSTANSPVQLWDVASGAREWIGTTTFANSNGARISPDGKYVFAVDGDTHVRAYDAKGKLLYAAESNLLEHFGVTVSTDGKTLAVAGAEGTVELRDSATGKLLKKSAGCGNPIFLVAMAPKTPTVLALILDAYTLHPAGIGYWNANSGELKQLPVDSTTVVGFGSDAKSLLLVRQESSQTLSVERVE